MPNLDTIEDVNDLTTCLGLSKANCNKKTVLFYKKKYLWFMWSNFTKNKFI